jgi:hypothetical protein
MDKEVLEMGRRYLDLQEEINKLQGQMSALRVNISFFLRESPHDIVASDVLNVMIKREITISERFNSKKLQKEDKIIYEDCKETTKRFNKKLVEKKYPKIYSNYLESIENESLTIQRMNKEE